MSTALREAAGTPAPWDNPNYEAAALRSENEYLESSHQVHLDSTHKGYGLLIKFALAANVLSFIAGVVFGATIW